MRLRASTHEATGRRLLAHCVEFTSGRADGRARCRFLRAEHIPDLTRPRKLGTCTRSFRPVCARLPLGHVGGDGKRLSSRSPEWNLTAALPLPPLPGRHCVRIALQSAFRGTRLALQHRQHHVPARELLIPPCHPGAHAFLRAIAATVESQSEKTRMGNPDLSAAATASRPSRTARNSKRVTVFPSALPSPSRFNSGALNAHAPMPSSWEKEPSAYSAIESRAWRTSLSDMQAIVIRFFFAAQEPTVLVLSLGSATINPDRHPRSKTEDSNSAHFTAAVVLHCQARYPLRLGSLVFLQITQYRAEGGDERRSIWVGHQSVAFYPLAKALESKDQQASGHAGRFQRVDQLWSDGKGACVCHQFFYWGAFPVRPSRREFLGGFGLGDSFCWYCRRRCCCSMRQRRLGGGRHWDAWCRAAWCR